MDGAVEEGVCLNQLLAFVSTACQLCAQLLDFLLGLVALLLLLSSILCQYVSSLLMVRSGCSIVRESNTSTGKFGRVRSSLCR